MLIATIKSEKIVNQPIEVIMCKYIKINKIIKNINIHIKFIKNLCTKIFLINKITNVKIKEQPINIPLLLLEIREENNEIIIKQNHNFSLNFVALKNISFKLFMYNNVIENKIKFNLLILLLQLHQ